MPSHQSSHSPSSDPQFSPTNPPTPFWWEELSRVELRRRLEQRGVDPRKADHIANHSPSYRRLLKEMLR